MGKKYPLLIIALIAIILLGIKSRSTGDAGEKVKIIRCHDGDTCTTDKGEKIRLACIDAPELKQPFGKASRDHLREIIKDRPVKIDRINTDRFGRFQSLIGFKINWNLGDIERYARSLVSIPNRV